MPAHKKIGELWLASRFVAVGLVNTGIGMSVILGLDLGLHLPPAVANGVGYGLGICLAWVMHRGFVFRAEDYGWTVKARYLTAVATAFSFNQLVLATVGHLSGGAPSARGLAQLLGVATYTVTQFVLMRTWVFHVRTAHRE